MSTSVGEQIPVFDTNMTLFDMNLNHIPDNNPPPTENSQPLDPHEPVQ